MMLATVPAVFLANAVGAGFTAELVHRIALDGHKATPQRVKENGHVLTLSSERGVSGRYPFADYAKRARQTAERAEG
jgi:hypothetical protein